MDVALLSAVVGNSRPDRKAAHLIREAAQAHGSTYPVIDATDMHDAVRRATDLCAPGDAASRVRSC